MGKLSVFFSFSPPRKRLKKRNVFIYLLPGGIKTAGDILPGGIKTAGDILPGGIKTTVDIPRDEVKKGTFFSSPGNRSEKEEIVRFSSFSPGGIKTAGDILPGGIKTVFIISSPDRKRTGKRNVFIYLSSPGNRTEEWGNCPFFSPSPHPGKRLEKGTFFIYLLPGGIKTAGDILPGGIKTVFYYLLPRQEKDWKKEEIVPFSFFPPGGRYVKISLSSSRSPPGGRRVKPFKTLRA